MISLKKYLDADAKTVEHPNSENVARKDERTLSAALAAYRSAMLAMGNCSLEACPGVGNELRRRLDELSAELVLEMPHEALQGMDQAVQEQIRDWGRRTADYYRNKAGEVKELLLAMARSVEAVGARDQRCATQMSQVTERLKQIATLDDLTRIRASVQKGAVELKNSIDRMKAEGKAAVQELRKELKSYQAKLEYAEELASRDALTGLYNRACLERMIETRIAAGIAFCVAMLDINGFKKVNDSHGHLVGDEVLKLFAAELRSACRMTDVVGRWGGDEFILLLDFDLTEAAARIERLSRWVIGDYTVHGNEETLKLGVDVSIGLAAHQPQESLKALVARADAAMYERKTAAPGATPLAIGRAP